MDLETQDHILNYQLPIAISRYNAGLVIIDSITANYRAEHSSNNVLALSNRSTELAKLGQLLRNLAARENIAIVVANQVSDRFEPAAGSGGDSALRPGFPVVLSQSATLAAREAANASPLPRSRAENAGLADNLMPSSSPASSPFAAQEDDQFDGSYIIGNPARSSILSLLHQERFFTGWGDGLYSDTSLKTPALGFFWSTQIACRIALKKVDMRTVLPSWDHGVYPVYPLSTPREQVDPQSQSQAEKPQISKPVVSSARDVHTTEIVAKPEVSDGKDQPWSTSQKAVPSQKQPAPEPQEHITRRRMKLVFAPWTSGSVKSLEGETGAATQSWSGKNNEIEFEIWKGGLRTARPEKRCVTK